MPQPYDYGIQANPMPNPMQGFLQGLQVVQAMQQQEAAQKQAEQRKTILNNLMALENPTADDFVQASLALPEDRELFKQAWDMHDQSKKDAIFRGGSEAYMLADSDPVGAKNKLEEWAQGFENAGDKGAADQFRAAAKIVETDPKAAKTTIGMMLSFADGERFKNVTQPSEATTFQKDFRFIKETFGDDAAAEFAQYGRDNIVSIPVGPGKTYVGPASQAPGAAKWQAVGSGTAQPDGVVEIGQRAQQSGTITQAEAGVIRQSLGPNGQAKFNEWLERNKIKVIVRTGTDANGRKIVQYADGTADYAGDGGGNATGGFRD